MAEPITKRIARLVSARVEDTVDRMEADGSERVMRETIREVERAIDLVQADYEAVATRRLQAIRQQKMFRDKARELEDKARYALSAERADLAEAALIRQVDLEEEGAKQQTVQAVCQEQETRLAENLSALKARKDDMTHALADFLDARGTAALGGDGPTRVQHDIEARVKAAEQAFTRAMKGAGGTTVASADAETTNRVAEIDVMRKRAAVVSRLTALQLDLRSA